MNIIQIEKLSEKKSVSELFKELFPYVYKFISKGKQTRGKNDKSNL